MSIEVSWYDGAQTIVLQSFKPDWTWEDFDQAHDETFALIRSQAHTVSFITDLSLAPSPPNPNIIGHLQRIVHQLPPNAGYIAVVGPGPFMRMMGDIFLNVMGKFGKSVTFEPTLEAAQRTICNRLDAKVA